MLQFLICVMFIRSYGYMLLILTQSQTACRELLVIIINYLSMYKISLLLQKVCMLTVYILTDNRADAHQTVTDVTMEDVAMAITIQISATVNQDVDTGSHCKSLLNRGPCNAFLSKTTCLKCLCNRHSTKLYKCG